MDRCLFNVKKKILESRSPEDNLPQIAILTVLHNQKVLTKIICTKFKNLPIR